MKYRAEIDGLRAFAVVPVILFHAGFETFSGGFVGVDVFFVISGYLITTIIVSELEAGTFSILNFYERRARRILPALFFVVAVSIPFAWMLLLPSDMRDFAQSVAAVSLFSSNILFWKESGYFAAAAELKPLLHTWSLAVEEQYYIIFPPLLVLLWGIGKTRVVYILFGLGVASLVAAQWTSANAPSFGFFMLPTRAFELLIGALVAFHQIDKDEIKGNNAFSLLGCTMVVYSIFAFDNQTPFPSVYTLLPTAGVALIILFTSEATITFKFLGNRMAVGIGLISYSAYLWHQPAFAFARHYASGEHLESETMLGLVALSLVLAYFSWRFVEAPFRGSKRFNMKQIFVGSAICSFLFISIGVMGHLTDGFIFRGSDEATTFWSAQKNQTNSRRGECHYDFYTTPFDSPPASLEARLIL